jgi:mono/diheme cytochrome c family protein
VKPAVENRHYHRLAGSWRRYSLTFSALAIAGLLCGLAPAADEVLLRRFFESNCAGCHSGEQPAGNLKMPEFQPQELSQQTAVWEKVVRRLETGDMPPAGSPRPAATEQLAVVEWLTGQLDGHSLRVPRPGRTESLRRLTRTEYQNSIRDLLGLQIDASSLLPADESSQGFDNITVTGLSPVLLSRYLAAAQKISRLALGRVEQSPGGETFRVRGDLTQDHMRPEGLPPGTRGGVVIDWTFPRSGSYQIQVRLMRDRNDELEGLHGRHQLDLLLDRRRVEQFIVERSPGTADDRQADANLIATVPVSAGRHQLAATFVDSGRALLETDRQPLNVHFNYYRHPRLGPAVAEVSITGPLGPSEAGSTESRRRILTRQPRDAAEFEACAADVFRPLLRLAFRRPITAADLETPLRLFREGIAEEQDFEAGIERGLAGILVNPQFLFRIERRSPGQPGAVSVSDIELASRLSFFLWSSLPDDELLTLAEAGTLSHPEVLRQQTARMLRDHRSASLAENFADQWLYLRNLESAAPDARLFPDFDQNLRDAFRRETLLLFSDMLQQDTSVLRLLDSRTAWLNERLARHYGIPHVHGSQFRRVELLPDQHRGGLLRQGSLLLTTSYATRTSPVLRGKWVLENLLGSPPPPPPPDVSALTENSVEAALPVWERLAAHRAHAACAACHDNIDPAGLPLENYDATGRWRELELERPVHIAGRLPGSADFQGVDGLERALLERPRLFVRTLAEKLMIYALGRGLEPDDGAAIRHVIRQAARDDYRFSAVIQGIVASVPFRMYEGSPP